MANEFVWDPTLEPHIFGTSFVFLELLNMHPSLVQALVDMSAMPGVHELCEMLDTKTIPRCAKSAG